VIIEETAILETLQIADDGCEEDRVSFSRRVWLARHLATLRAEVNATFESPDWRPRRNSIKLGNLSPRIERACSGQIRRTL